MLASPLTISLVYLDPYGGQSTLRELAANRGVIAAEDLSPDAFFAAQGGLRLSHSRFHVFLFTSAAGELYEYVAFLLGALAKLAPGTGPLDRFACDDSYGGHDAVVGVLVQEDQSTLVVARGESGRLRLSFLDPDGAAPSEPESPYFDGDAVELDEAEWRKATVDALDAYFAVAKARLGRTRAGPLADLLDAWRTDRARVRA